MLRSNINRNRTKIQPTTAAEENDSYEIDDEHDIESTSRLKRRKTTENAWIMNKSDAKFNQIATQLSTDLLLKIFKLVVDKFTLNEIVHLLTKDPDDDAGLKELLKNLITEKPLTLKTDWRIPPNSNSTTSENTLVVKLGNSATYLDSPTGRLLVMHILKMKIRLNKLLFEVSHSKVPLLTNDAKMLIEVSKFIHVEYWDGLQVLPSRMFDRVVSIGKQSLSTYEDYHSEDGPVFRFSPILHILHKWPLNGLSSLTLEVRRISQLNILREVVSADLDRKIRNFTIIIYMNYPSNFQNEMIGYLSDIPSFYREVGVDIDLKVTLINESMRIYLTDEWIRVFLPLAPYITFLSFIVSHTVAEFEFIERCTQLEKLQFILNGIKFENGAYDHMKNAHLKNLSLFITEKPIYFNSFQFPNLTALDIFIDPKIEFSDYPLLDTITHLTINCSITTAGSRITLPSQLQNLTIIHSNLLLFYNIGDLKHLKNIDIKYKGTPISRSQLYEMIPRLPATLTTLKITESLDSMASTFPTSMPPYPNAVMGVSYQQPQGYYTPTISHMDYIMNTTHNSYANEMTSSAMQIDEDESGLSKLPSFTHLINLQELQISGLAHNYNFQDYPTSLNHLSISAHSASHQRPIFKIDIDFLDMDSDVYVTNNQQSSDDSENLNFQISRRDLFKQAKITSFTHNFNVTTSLSSSSSYLKQSTLPKSLISAYATGSDQQQLNEIQLNPELFQIAERIDIGLNYLPTRLWLDDGSGAIMNPNSCCNSELNKLFSKRQLQHFPDTLSYITVKDISGNAFYNPGCIIEIFVPELNQNVVSCGLLKCGIPIKEFRSRRCPDVIEDQPQYQQGQQQQQQQQHQHQHQQEEHANKQNQDVSQQRGESLGIQQEQIRAQRQQLRVQQIQRKQRQLRQRVQVENFQERWEGARRELGISDNNYLEVGGGDFDEDVVLEDDTF
ncbi:unnamed protein product [Ambrosiozyma monospora]|uniref:Unnamed protein product n=1 Tax=Ambrosiozyma monospora TaxID=43982 RepID=A0A9W6TAG3_AMBMO|nr:unnamed protein product [Ambrosiozyma monospora]